jgi:hypothetical protein
VKERKRGYVFFVVAAPLLVVFLFTRFFRLFSRNCAPMFCFDSANLGIYSCSLIFAAFPMPICDVAMMTTFTVCVCCTTVTAKRALRVPVRFFYYIYFPSFLKPSPSLFFPFFPF